MRLIPILALVLLPQVSLAQQDAAVDPGITAACLADTPPGQQDPDCIGAAARTCQEARPADTINTNACVMAEHDAWDAALNAEYGKTREQWADRPELAQALLDAQRAWLAFRDAECALSAARYGGGSMAGTSRIYCLMETTARRTFALRDLRRP